MVNILVAGGAGYVGGYLVDSIIKDYHSDLVSVTVYDSLIYEDRYLKDVNFIKGDIRDREKLSNILADYDTVIWLAALVGDGACAINPELTKEINEDSVKWLVDNYKGKIVFMSTCSVYGINNDLIDEEATPNPLSVYAATKLEAEKYIMKNSKNPLVFRLGTLYGVGDEHSRIRLDLVANVLSKRATLGEELSVYGGEQWRPLLHVKDVSLAILYCLDRNISGLYNLGSGNYTISQMAESIQKVIPNVKVKHQELKFEDQRNYRVKTDRILATGWKPKYNLEDGIREMYKIIKEGRIKDVNDSVYSNVDYLKKIGV